MVKTSPRRAAVAPRVAVSIAPALYGARPKRSVPRPYWVEASSRPDTAPPHTRARVERRRAPLMTDWPATLDPPRSPHAEPGFSVPPWAGKPFLLATLWGLRRSKRNKSFT